MSSILVPSSSSHGYPGSSMSGRTSSKQTISLSINFDQKQRINLSPRAVDVLGMDADNFAEGQNRTGFINELLRRCTPDCDASIDLASGRHRQQLEETLKKGMARKEAESSVVRKSIDLLVREYEEGLVEKALSWPKGESFVFRLSNDNCKAFYGEDEEDVPLYPLPACYGGKVSRYLKAILEEYASHTQYDREALYFHEEIGMIRLAMETEKSIRVVSSNPNHIQHIFDVRIYDILPDDSGMRHYIVGMVAQAGGAKAQEQIASLRLSRIRSVRILDSRSARSGKISAAQRKEIEARMASSRVQFLLSGQEDIVVRLSDAGKSTFNYVQYMRPKIDYIDEEGNYHFSCSRMQAKNYFSKFGAGAEILSPQELRNELALLYQEASALYGKPT